MKQALQICATVKEFEQYLELTNSIGRPNPANIAVIDADGAAAIFEAGNNSFVRFDANDAILAPEGFLARANFSLSADTSEQYVYACQQQHHRHVLLDKAPVTASMSIRRSDINAVERFLGDEALKRGWAFEKAGHSSGKRVLVVGAGPSGLSAAYQLTRYGHTVEIHEAGPFAGGMMRFGIPKYRLPREVIEAEVQRIIDLGVTLKLNTKIANIADAMKAGKFDAAFLAVGAHIGKRAFIPAADATRIVDAVSVLRSMEGEEKPMLGRRVVVYGGGNTAIDVARTAKRMGAEEAIIVYRRTREKAPAHDFEIEEALQEGVLVKWLSTIKQADEGEITIEKMALDDKGFPQPTGEFEKLAADSVVLALGQDVDLGLLEGVPGAGGEGRRGAGRPEHDDRPRRHLRRRRHGAFRAYRHCRRRPRQESRAPHRRLAGRRNLRGATQA